MFVLCSATVDETAISTLNTLNWSAGITAVMTGAAGNHQAEFAAVMRALSRGTLATRKLDALAAPVLGDGALFFRGVDQGGLPNSDYISLTGTAGKVLWVPRMVDWSEGQPARLTLEALFLSSDGTTAPITVGTASGDLTAEADVWVGDGTGIQSLSVDFGFQIATPGDGHLYQVNSFIQAQRPSIRVRTVNEADITSGNLNPGSVSSLSAVFAKVADGGVRGALRTYTVTGHRRVEQVAGAKPGTVEIVVQGKGGVTIS